jgi:GntR family transcriptional regulator
MTVDNPRQDGSNDSPSNLSFRLDNHSGVPTYLQLVHQVEHAIELGYLHVGDQLPRLRDVVSELSINPGTVLKAYRDLEQKGLIRGRTGVGTFVTAAPQAAGREKSDKLTRDLAAWVSRARAAGLSDAAIEGLVDSTLRSAVKTNETGVA